MANIWFPISSYFLSIMLAISNATRSEICFGDQQCKEASQFQSQNSGVNKDQELSKDQLILLCFAAIFQYESTRKINKIKSKHKKNRRHKDLCGSAMCLHPQERNDLLHYIMWNPYKKMCNSKPENPHQYSCTPFFSLLPSQNLEKKKTQVEEDLTCTVTFLLAFFPNLN